MALKHKYFWFIAIPILFLLPCLFVASNISTVHEIDIHSGRTRIRNCFFKMTFRTMTYDTVFSNAAAEGNTRKQACWKIDSCFTVLSPHISLYYPYHGTIHKIDMLFRYIERYPLPPKYKNKLAKFIVKLLENNEPIWLFGKINFEDGTLTEHDIMGFIDQLDNNKLSQNEYAFIPAKVSKCDCPLLGCVCACPTTGQRAGNAGQNGQTEEKIDDDSSKNSTQKEEFK